MKHNISNLPEERTNEFIKKTIHNINFISLNASNMFE